MTIGEDDPNAPPGWPLAIGDADVVEFLAPGGVREDFEYWEGNCCVNWVDGVPYTARWRVGMKDDQLWEYYEGHVRAEPTVAPSEAVRLRLRRIERNLASVPPLSAMFQESLERHMAKMEARIEYLERRGL